MIGKYLHRHPVDSWLEYIYFMKIGQSKLSERQSQRSGLFVTKSENFIKSRLMITG